MKGAGRIFTHFVRRFLGTPRKPLRPASRKRGRRPEVEQLEDLCLLTAYAVGFGAYSQSAIEGSNGFVQIAIAADKAIVQGHEISVRWTSGNQRAPGTGLWLPRAGRPQRRGGPNGHPVSRRA